MRKAKGSGSARSVVTTTQAANLPEQAAAKVGPYLITKDAVEHWMSILVVTDGNDIPRTKDPGRGVPQPPSYRACIRHAKEGLARARIKMEEVVIAQKCAQLRRALTAQAVEMLIDNAQLFGKAAERAVAVRPREARRRLAALVREEFPSQSAYRNYLHITGQTEADKLYYIKVLLLSGKLIASFASGSTHTLTPATQQTLVKLSKKWIAATSCRPEYLIALCGNYKQHVAKPPALSTLFHELRL